MIRGAGAEKEDGERNFERELLELDGHFMEEEDDEPLHVYLSADTK
jgi:hypothetical protein